MPAGLILARSQKQPKTTCSLSSDYAMSPSPARFFQPRWIQPPNASAPSHKKKKMKLAISLRALQRRQLAGERLGLGLGRPAARNKLTPAFIRIHSRGSTCMWLAIRDLSSGARLVWPAFVLKLDFAAACMHHGSCASFLRSVVHFALHKYDTSLSRRTFAYGIWFLSSLSPSLLRFKHRFYFIFLASSTK